MKKRLITVLSVILTFLMLGGTFSFAANVSPVKVDQFTDVSAQDWHYDYVDFVSKNAYMIGTSETTFEPQSNLTRAMFATILARYDKAVVDDSKETIFNDVPVDQWYTGSIGWANEKAIVQGYGDGNFGTNDAITRQDLSLMIIRYIRFYEKEHKVKIKTHGGEWKGDITFTDESDIRQDVETPAAIKDLVKYGVLLGYPDGTVKPTQNITRAETAAIIKRLDWILTPPPTPGPSYDETEYVVTATGSSPIFDGSLYAGPYGEYDNVTAEQVLTDLFGNTTKIANGIQKAYDELEGTHVKTVDVDGASYTVTVNPDSEQPTITIEKDGAPVAASELEAELKIENDLYLDRMGVIAEKGGLSGDALDAWNDAVEAISPDKMITVDGNVVTLNTSGEYAEAAKTVAVSLGKMMDALGEDFDDAWSKVQDYLAAPAPDGLGITKGDNTVDLKAEDLADALATSNVVAPLADQTVLNVEVDYSKDLLNLINALTSRNWAGDEGRVPAVVAIVKALQEDVDSPFQGLYTFSISVSEKTE